MTLNSSPGGTPAGGRSVDRRSAIHAHLQKKSRGRRGAGVVGRVRVSRGELGEKWRRRKAANNQEVESGRNRLVFFV